jgi:YD repeat-containing protein
VNGVNGVTPGSGISGRLSCKYDAWNRLVVVKDGQTVVGKYEYDGLGRRTKKHIDSQGPGSPKGIERSEHLDYNASWQVLETRDTTSENDQPEGLQPDDQYVWSAQYIDALVLRDKNTDANGLCDDQRLYYLCDVSFNKDGSVQGAG